jgi:hypothetical protein
MHLEAYTKEHCTMVLPFAVFFQRFKVLDDLRGVELECKLQSLSFALAGGSRIDILGPPG